MLEQFVPVADEVGRLQRGKDVECRTFQEFAEQGHYKGRTQPSNTRQGIYAVAPSGKFLASCNTRHAHVVARMLRRALHRWQELEASERHLPAARIAELGKTKRWIDGYPEDGLVLRITTRDLPRTSGDRASRPRDWRARAWNLDYAWFKKSEAKQFVPPKPKVGARRAVPQPLIRRLVRLNLLDNVRGQVPPFGEHDVQTARLIATVDRVEGDIVRLKLTGATRAVRKGRWRIQGFSDRPTQQEIGLETRLLGHAAFDRQRAQFVEFDLVAVGKRWGGTQFNARGDDLAASPIGAVLQLASGARNERIAPARIWDYHW